MMWHDGWGAGGWLVMGFMMLIFWALVIGAVVWVARGRNQTPTQNSNYARQILDDRFARGEIDADEYRQRREHLTAP